MEECLQELRNTIICRDAVIRNLYSLIGFGKLCMPESIFAFGHTATGKSLVVRSVLQYLSNNFGYKFSIVNCIEHPNSKHLLECIMTDLSSCSLESSNAYKVSRKCDNLLEFILHLKNITHETNSPIVIVFEKSDRLRDLEANLLSAFLRLRELSSVNICTVFLSDIVWEKYIVKTGINEPIKLHFPQYNRDEMMQILMLYKPKEANNYDDTFYKHYLNLFVSVYFRFCRDFSELRYMANINFSKYVEPIESKQCDENDSSVLWRNISNVFKSNLNMLYLRVSAEDLVKRIELAQEIESTMKLVQSFELPFYAKYMLIAAYLASHNPIKADKHLYKKESDKKKRKAKINRKKIISNNLAGPRNFSLSRMLAIFCSIIGEQVDLNLNLMAQIPTMCRLGLLANVVESKLDEPKFKCCVDYEFIYVISQMVAFDIKNYLYEFIA